MELIKIICFLVAGVCFIMGLKLLGKTKSARKGNLVSALGMLAAIIGAFVSLQPAGTEAAVAAAGDAAEATGGLGLHNYLYIAIGITIGGLIGAIAARVVQMTAMPEMVALFNGFGGIASLLVAWAQLHWCGVQAADPQLIPDIVRSTTFENLNIADMTEAEIFGRLVGSFSAATIFIAALIGGVTFTGSIIAYGKLSGRIPTKPILYKGQNLVNAALVLVMGIGLACFAIWPDQYWLFIIACLIALVLGVAAVIPIGGADMPVVISLLNSYSGLAACAAGFAVSNTLLITTGALVGASGIILTKIMCKAMNRSLANVLFSGFGSSSGGSTKQADGPQGEAKVMSPEDAYYILEAAQSVVFIPGYGMAVAQAQHAVRELTDMLEANGSEVKHAIHPVAGRMPGHMNVLLAEANVPYEQLVEMDDINPVMETMDVAIVIGANDVVNPAAREEEGSPIYGMPVINADQARTVFVLKRSMASGFAGIENPLFFKDNTYMVLGDAKATVEAMINEFKSAAE